MISTDQETSTYSIWERLQDVSQRLVTLDCPDAHIIASLRNILSHRQLDAKIDFVCNHLQDVLDRDASRAHQAGTTGNTAGAADGAAERATGSRPSGSPTSYSVAFGSTVSRRERPTDDTAAVTEGGADAMDGADGSTEREEEEARAREREEVRSLYREFVQCVQAIKSC